MHKQQFARGKTIIHRLDPRLKLILAALYTTILAVSFNFFVLGAGLLIGIGLLILARLELRPVVCRLLVVNSFLLFIWLVLPFTTPGEIFYSLGPLKLSESGLQKVLQLTVRTNSILLFLMALVSTTKISAITRALAGLGVPDKLVGLFFIAFRYLQDLHREYLAIYRAALARGFQPATGWHTYRTFAHLFGQLFLKAFEKSNRVYDAMRCRGVAGVPQSLETTELKFRDYCVGLIGLLILAPLMLLWGG